MKSNLPYLKHILTEILFLIKETKDLKFEEFKNNELLKRASTRSIEIIGEAVKNISLDFRNKHNEIDWKKIAGMRDKIIHYYFGVNWDTIWDVIKNKIPALKDKIEKIIEENKDK